MKFNLCMHNDMAPTLLSMAHRMYKYLVSEDNAFTLTTPFSQYVLLFHLWHEYCFPFTDLFIVKFFFLKFS